MPQSSPPRSVDGRPSSGTGWSLDYPATTERLARLGYDYVSLDAQHGLFGYSGMLAGLTAIDAGGQAVGMVRVAANDATPIGRALDAGAAGVIVPLVNTAEDAANAVAASRYPPVGIRSYGPMRSMLRIGPTPAEANETVIVLAMIETPEGLANVEAIAATPGLDGLYIGPSDLTLAVGGTDLDRPVGRRRVRGGAGPHPRSLREQRHRRRPAHPLRRGGGEADLRGLHPALRRRRPQPPRSRGEVPPRRGAERAMSELASESMSQRVRAARAERSEALR